MSGVVPHLIGRYKAWGVICIPRNVDFTTGMDRQHCYLFVLEDKGSTGFYGTAEKIAELRVTGGIVLVIESCNFRSSGGLSLYTNKCRKAIIRRKDVRL